MWHDNDFCMEISGIQCSAKMSKKSEKISSGSRSGSNIFCDCVAKTQHFLRVSFAFVFGICVVCFRTVIGHNVSNFRSRFFARAHHSSFFVNEDISFRLNRRSKSPSDFLTSAPSCHLASPNSSPDGCDLDFDTCHNSVLVFTTHHTDHDKTSLQPVLSLQSIGQTTLHCQSTTKRPQS